MNNRINGNNRIFLIRMAETLVGSAVIGGVLLWGTVKTIGADVNAVKQDISEIKEQVRQFRKDFYIPRHSEQSSVIKHHPALVKMRGY